VDTIITTTLPMVLSDRQEISTVAGLIDFAHVENELRG
jgi:hypothetical protein